MTRSRFSEEQIIGILKEHLAGLGAKAGPVPRRELICVSSGGHPSAGKLPICETD